MGKPKIFLKDWNGVLTNISTRTDDFEFVLDPRDADAIVVWQDVRTAYLQLASMNTMYYHKPFIVVQHGRACTREYGPPEHVPLLATKFCCWGQEDYDRMKSYGYGDRTVITGCPLLTYKKPKEEHGGKNILFVPIITTQEEVDNIIVFWELKKLELNHAQNVLRKHRKELLNEWNPKVVNPDSKDCFPTQDEMKNHNIVPTIPFYNINKDWRLSSKLIEIHDKNLYISPYLLTHPGKPKHVEETVKLLAKTDVVVCVEEGTLQTLAMAMDIPIVVVKGFKLLNYMGMDLTQGRKVVHTPAAEWVELSELGNAIERELANPERLAKERKEVVLREFGNIPNPDDNIVREIKESIKNG